MPGFVNAHAHTPMTLLRSFKDDVTLDEATASLGIPVLPLSVSGHALLHALTQKEE
jgi:cytosine/adenosine deaminase-related metal-dependent hydrolase